MPLMLVLFFSTWFRSFTSFNATLMGRPDPSFLGAPILPMYSGSDSSFRHSNIFRVVFLMSAASGTPSNTTFRARYAFASSSVYMSSNFLFRFEISSARPSIIALVLCSLLSSVSRLIRLLLDLFSVLVQSSSDCFGLGIIYIASLHNIYIYISQ